MQVFAAKGSPENQSAKNQVFLGCSTEFLHDISRKRVTSVLNISLGYCSPWPDTGLWNYNAVYNVFYSDPQDRLLSGLSASRTQQDSVA